jgi:hypothetical protein
VFRDAGASIAAGSGCSTLPDGGVLCSPDREYPELWISLGDKDDRLTDDLSDFDRVTVAAGDGADRITVNPQFADVSGQSGSDVIRASGNALTGLQSGGEGDDTITIFNAQGSIEGGPGDDTLTGGTQTSGDDGNDVITTDLWFDSAHGGGGDDAIDIPCGVAFGDGGGDRLTGPDPSNPDSCAVELHGGDGQDRLTGSGTDVPDLLDGGADDDAISGLAGPDNLSGGSGDDLLDGGAGDDLLHGGNGADTILGLGGIDAVDYSDRTAGVTVTLDGASGSGNADDGPAGARDRVGADVEEIFGGGGPDALTGNAAANFIDGGAGDDAITTRDAGRDVAFCADGTDRAVVDAADEVDPSCETTVLPGATPSGRPTPVRPPVVVPEGDAPSLDVTLSPRQHRRRVLVRGLTLRTRCSEPCRITGRLVVRGREAKRLGLSRRRKPVIAARGEASAPGTLTLRFTARAQRRLQAARRLTLTLRIQATDPAGNVATSVQRLTFRGKRVTLAAPRAGAARVSHARPSRPTSHRRLPLPRAEPAASRDADRDRLP